MMHSAVKSAADGAHLATSPNARPALIKPCHAFWPMRGGIPLPLATTLGAHDEVEVFVLSTSKGVGRHYAVVARDTAFRPSSASCRTRCRRGSRRGFARPGMSAFRA